VREFRLLGSDAIAACGRALEAAEASLAMPIDHAREPLLIESAS